MSTTDNLFVASQGQAIVLSYYPATLVFSTIMHISLYLQYYQEQVLLLQMCTEYKYLLFCTLGSWFTYYEIEVYDLIIPFSLCLLLFLSLKMYLKIKITLQTTFSSNLKSFGSGLRKEN